MSSKYSLINMANPVHNASGEKCFVGMRSRDDRTVKRPRLAVGMGSTLVAAHALGCQRRPINSSRGGDGQEGEGARRRENARALVVGMHI